MFQILDIYWSLKNSEAQSDPAKKEYVPKIKIYDSIAKDIKSFELKDYDFNFKLSKKRYCTGYYKDGEFALCKLADQNGLGQELDSNSSTQCRLCENIQGFKTAFLLKGDVNENMKKYLAQMHYIYLAYFEPGIVKVGTAAESRKFIRPIEQDALIYSYIAQSDGFNIQKLERFISKNIGITEFVKSSHKFKHLASRPDPTSAGNLLKSNFQKIESLLYNHIEFENWLFDSIEVVDLSENAAIYYPDNKVNQIKTYEHLSGKYLGLRGRYLMLNNYAKIVAFDINPIIGRTFEVHSSQGTAEDSFEYSIEADNQLGFGL